MDKYRDSSGFIDIEKMNINNITEVRNYDGFSFMYEGERYYFKRVRSIEHIYNEMIAFELAQDFGIESIPYDLASYDNNIGFLSKDFFNPCMVYLEDILINFYGNDKDKCNLNDVCFVLEERFPKEVKDRIEKQLIDLLMFDLIIGNPDRHDRNIIIDIKKGGLAPIFDNELLLTNEPYDDERYCFSLISGEKNTLNSFLSFMDEETVKKFVSKIDIISTDNIIKIIDRVEKKIGCSLNKYIRDNLIKKFAYQYYYLIKTVKSFDKCQGLALF